jgi:hypothetical protein
MWAAVLSTPDLQDDGRLLLWPLRRLTGKCHASPSVIIEGKLIGNFERVCLEQL